MNIISFQDVTPRIEASVFVAPNVWIIGDVSIQEKSSVFYGSVLRGDILPITIGRNTNIQEHSILHTSVGLSPCIVGDNVTVGHRSTLHGCQIERNCLIGMGSTLLDNSHIGEYSLIGAHTLITMNTRIPPRSLVLGSPGKVVRELTDKEIEELQKSADHYVEVSRTYLELFQ